MMHVPQLLRRLGLAVVFTLSCSIAGAAPAPQGGLPTPVQPYCSPCQNPNFFAYNRCSYWSIDDQNLACDAPTCQSLFRIDSRSKKASIRFTLSHSPTGNQTMSSVWLYYRTIGDFSAAEYVLRVCEDAGGVPGTILNLTSFRPQANGTVGWHQIQLTSPVSGLVPGNVYHLVVAPRGFPSPSKCIELVVSRGRFPVRYLPTDAPGTALESPCDRWLAIMQSDSTRSPVAGTDFFLVEAAGNRGYTPIFVVDLGPSGLFGAPYNEHVERVISGPNQYGQVIQVPAATDVNYVAFWLRGMGCHEDCANPPCPIGDLEFRLLSSPNPNAPPTVLIPHSRAYRGRSHWFGAFFPTQHLAAGTYYLVLSSPNSSGTGADGWQFSMENSTLPVNFASIPTYLKGNSYAIESKNGGNTFQPLSRKGDTGFMLGYFPDGQQEIARLCDHGVTVQCGSNPTYARTAQPGDVIKFGASNLNIGHAQGRLQYMRLLALDCTPLSNPEFCIETGPVSENTHALGGDIQWTMGQNDAFLWLEFGHQDPNNPSNLIADELFPIEIRKGCSPCGSCP
ncbi:MAG: hypothetical protein ACKVXR_10015 [Planctomycetota bacterium]